MPEPGPLAGARLARVAGPTGRRARFSSGLSVLDYMKRTSILRLGPEQLRALGPAAITLAQCEGLDAHARSVAIRLNLAG